VKVIRVEDGQIVTRAGTAELAVDAAGQVPAAVARGVLKLVVAERHGRNGQIGLGFVSGFGPMRGALASTVAHDSHNIIAVGADDQSLLTAITAVIAMQGGQAVAEGDHVIARLALPLAGLMSLQSAPAVAAATGELREAAHALGSTLSHPFMSLSFLALPVIPELKLTDRGLVDVGRFEVTSVFAG
jgi:adenine deaminase